jgi:hypothetical protein
MTRTATTATINTRSRAVVTASPQALSLAATRQAKRGITVSAETMRRWLPEVG